MTTPSYEPHRVGLSASALAARAVLPGLGFAVVAGGAVVASGRLPDGVALYVALGGGIAAVTGGLGAAFKARAVARGSIDAHATQQLQIALFGDFVLQLFTVGLTMLGMFLAGVKFDFLVGFALAFATVAVGHQIGSSLVLARALRRRAASGAVPGASTSPAVLPDPANDGPAVAASPLPGSGPGPGSSASSRR